MPIRRISIFDAEAKRHHGHICTIEIPAFFLSIRSHQVGLGPARYIVVAYCGITHTREVQTHVLSSTGGTFEYRFRSTDR
jgi:hypothetical protein